MSIRFTIDKHCAESSARTGRIETPHGSFDTPAFMPVGTRGTIKGVTPDHIAATGSQIVLNNAYHLMLRPGDDLVARLGGVHQFMQWNGPILTDSGGYQAYSMSDINAIDDDGVTFTSIIDGSKVHLGPERAMQVQNNLGADIIMAFDDCPPSVDPAAINESRRRLALGRTGPFKKGYDHAARLGIANERTVSWLERCVKAHARPSDQSLFGIVQGGTDLDLRRQSAERITNIDLPGYAIGGVAVGEGTELIRQITEFTAPLLPVEKPRYLMGVGYERDIVAAVRAGVDMFDCVLPTRNGRNANAFTQAGALRLRNAEFRDDPRPIEAGCDCLACAGPPAIEGLDGPAPGRHWGADRRGRWFSRAYLRHLFLSKEMLGPILLSIHNIRHFQRLMLDIRRAICENDWLRLRQDWPVLNSGSLSE